MAAAQAQANSLACLLAQAEKVCLGDIQPSVCAGTAYASFISSTGPVGPIVKTSGTLPPGIILSGGGFLIGTPTTAGTYIFTVQANSASGYTTRTYSITIGAVTTSALPDAENGTAYAQALSSVGMTNPTWAVIGGTLPPGLSLSIDGIISGIPVGGTGDYNFVVEATE